MVTIREHLKTLYLQADCCKKISAGENKMENNDDKTMIVLSKENRTKLGEIRICKRESYDEVITRLLNKFKEE